MADRDDDEIMPETRTRGLRTGFAGGPSSAGQPTTGFSTSTSLLARLTSRASTFRFAVQQALNVEDEHQSWFNFYPVALGVGIAAYFALPHEPMLWAPAVLVVVLAAVAVRLDIARARGRWFLIFCLIFAGLSVAKVRTEFAATPMLASEIATGVSGIIVARDVRSNGSVRYTIAPKKIDRWEGRLPPFVRISQRKPNELLEVGATMSAFARLSPVGGPLVPRGFDFAFHAYFSGIGANGFMLGSPKRAGPSPSSMSLHTRSSVAINQLRSAVRGRIEAAIPGHTGALAAALIVGDRSGIPSEVNDHLRRAGLAHILAISGLHMVLVTGTVLYVIRFGFALFPGLILRFPAKKLAAAGALIVATIYLLLSGMGIATQRAFIMLSVMLIAVLADRRAITMRNVAIAALIVLIIAPQSLVSPSFQMSFAAVAALVAAYEVWRSREHREKSTFGWLNAARNASGWVGGLTMTSLVAGTATSVYAAYHFYRIAPLGLIANVLAMPIVTLAIMPLALASVFLMPFGLESLALYPMALAIDAVIEIAHAAEIYSPSGSVGQLPVSALLVGTTICACLFLLRSWFRFAGLALVPVFAGITMVQQTPDIIISENGKRVGVLDVQHNTDTISVSGSRRAGFAIENWQNAYQVKAEKGQFRCDRSGCAIRLSNGLLMAHSRTPQGLSEDCEIADIVVTSLNAAKLCSSRENIIVVDSTDLARSGAQSLRFANDRMPQSGTPDPQTSHPLLNRPDAAQRRALLKSMIRESAYTRHPRPWTQHRHQ
ncbi:MAG: ComEC/Rec2 family competence protein [Pseudomonadota bacterium]